MHDKQTVTPEETSADDIHLAEVVEEVRKPKKMAEEDLNAFWHGD